MNRFNSQRAIRGWPLTPRRILLLAVVAVALGMGMVSNRIALPVRAAWREALRPGLQVLNTTDQWTHNLLGGMRSDSEQQLSKAHEQVAELTKQLQRLELQLQLAHSDIADNNVQLAAAVDSAGLSKQLSMSPLLNCQMVSARVLGRQAQAFLQSRDILDVGQLQGIAAKSLVIDDLAHPSDRPMLDQGRDAAVRPDRLVLAGRRVWGKVAEVGRHTSTVLRTTDANYRDLVQLATEREGRLHFTTRGVLVGKGEPWCKIELVETTQSVSVGDLVFTADDGVLDAPLFYGRVSKVERKSGDARWEIWMTPAVADSRPPDRVAVLQMELNPGRVAKGQ